MTARRTTAVSIAATALVAIGTLTGCAGATPDLAADAATQLQADVLAVSEASAAGDVDKARTALDTLIKHLDSARDAGSVSAARQDRIESSIAVVAADLTALKDQADQDARADADANQAAAEQAAAEKAARDKAAADAADEAARAADEAARDKAKQDKKDQEDAEKETPSPTPTTEPTTEPEPEPTTEPTTEPEPEPDPTQEPAADPLQTPNPPADPA